MSKRKLKWLSVVASLCLIIAIICASFQLVAFSSSFYDYQWEKRDTVKALGTTVTDLERMKQTILGILSGKRNDMELQGKIDGQVTDVFTQEDTLHMLDVQKLLRNDAIAMYIMLATFALIAVYIFIKKKREGIKKLAKVYLITLLSAVAVTGIVVLIASRDFDASFTVFHKLLFTNDLWLMPQSSVVIRLMPIGFFVDAGYGVARMLILLSCVSAAAAISVFFGKIKHPADYNEETLYQG